MRKYIPLAFIAGAYIFSATVYSRLPDRVATHWNIHGQVDGWMSRPWSTLLLPTIALAVWALLVWLPSIDPKHENYAKFRDTYDLVVAVVIGFMVSIHVLILGVSIGWPIPINRVVPLGVGLLFVVIGNALPRARPNWFFGIRTPWTLSNDRVWERTHRVGGYVMIAAGIVTMASAALTPFWSFWVLMAAALMMAITTIGYSYIVWRQETR